MFYIDKGLQCLHFAYARTYKFTVGHWKMTSKRDRVLANGEKLLVNFSKTITSIFTYFVDLIIKIISMIVRGKEVELKSDMLCFAFCLLFFVYKNE